MVEFDLGALSDKYYFEFLNLTHNTDPIDYSKNPQERFNELQ